MIIHKSIISLATIFLSAVIFTGCKDGSSTSSNNLFDQTQYPPVWFAPINDPNKPDWEILPQETKAGEVILSKRNELGILSNFAATPFER